MGILFQLGGMMKTVVAFCLALSFSGTALAIGPFSYNAKKGKCLDAQGNTGFNRLEDSNLGLPADLVETDSAGNVIDVVYSQRSAECVDLSHVDIDAMIRKPEYGWGYITLDNWNLNGALLNGTRIAFSVGSISMLGANATNLMAGYLMATVTYDKFTVGLNPNQCPRTKSPQIKQCDVRY